MNVTIIIKWLQYWTTNRRDGWAMIWSKIQSGMGVCATLVEVLLGGGGTGGRSDAYYLGLLHYCYIRQSTKVLPHTWWNIERCIH